MANGFCPAYVTHVLAIAQQHMSAPTWRARTGQAVYELTQMQRELGLLRVQLDEMIHRRDVFRHSFTFEARAVASASRARCACCRARARRHDVV